MPNTTPTRLSGLDATFLAIETANSQMHTLKLSILESTDAGRPLAVQSVIDAVRGQLHAVSCYTQRLQFVPFGIHHPLLVGATGFDLDDHVHVRSVPAPGGRAERDAVIAEICGGRLDRTKPLWELWILDGLEMDRIGCLLKLHHSIADGRVATNQLLTFTGADPNELRISDTAVRTSRLILDGFRDRVRDLSALPALVKATRSARRAVREIREDADVDVPGLLGGPVSRFSRRVSLQRTWSTVSVPVSAIAEVAKAYRVSINDVLLTMVGTAVRTLLEVNGELPDEPLVAGVPVDISRPEESDELQGNRWATAMTTLATNLPDTVDRLYAVHDCMTVSKRIRDARADLMHGWAQYANLPLVQGVMRAASRSGLLGRARLTSFGISNVRGPAEALTSGPIRVVDFYSVGPLMEGSGVNVTAWSYAGRFNISLLSAANILDDGEYFLGLMIAALDDLTRRQPAQSANKGPSVRVGTT